MTQPRSSLATVAASVADPDPAKGRAAGKWLWQKLGLVVVYPPHHGWAAEAKANNLGRELYGPRTGK